MTDQHPIIPPPQLVQQWQEDWYCSKVKHAEYESFIAVRAAQWGADAELEKCCEVLHEKGYLCNGSMLRAARRPPASTEADRALAALKVAPKAGAPTIIVGVEQYNTILRALQRLKELEGLAND